MTHLSIPYFLMKASIQIYSNVKWMYMLDFRIQYLEKLYDATSCLSFWKVWMLQIFWSTSPKLSIPSTRKRLQPSLRMGQVYVNWCVFRQFNEIRLNEEKLALFETDI